MSHKNIEIIRFVKVLKDLNSNGLGSEFDTRLKDGKT